MAVKEQMAREVDGETVVEVFGVEPEGLSGGVLGW